MRSLLEAHFVCLAENADRMSPEVRALGVRHLASARTLPFILLTDAEGEWLGGSSGATSPQALLALLQRAVGAAP